MPRQDRHTLPLPLTPFLRPGLIGFSHVHEPADSIVQPARSDQYLGDGAICNHLVVSCDAGISPLPYEEVGGRTRTLGRSECLNLTFAAQLIQLLSTRLYSCEASSIIRSATRVHPAPTADVHTRAMNRLQFRPSSSGCVSLRMGPANWQLPQWP